MDVKENYAIFDSGELIGVVQKGDNFDSRLLELLQEHFDCQVNSLITPDEMKAVRVENYDAKHKFECIVDENVQEFEFKITWIY